ncbi:hypothetical protein E4U43_001836 [Claviceps pusilla]|uniref:Uncharacterized protein n=1 Tax=Claviceps pusilla TaxID=123648 RepID=A0A9P7N9I2_9HYPO|nr:hypothetical protein E4U43_001836 [Claviceps pusilla]
MVPFRLAPSNEDLSGVSDFAANWQRITRLAWRREGPLWTRGSAFGGRGGFYGHSSRMDPGFPRSGFPSAQCKRQRDRRSTRGE